MNQLGRAPSHQRGMSILELLVGVAVGLVVVAGAVKLMVDTLGSDRQLLLETRVNQDLRAAADFIVRDIRRAGYWENAIRGVFSTTGSGTVVTNPYRDISLASNVIGYRYGRKEDNPSMYNTVEPVERSGFCLRSGVLEFRNGADDDDCTNNTWQPITDPKVVTITDFTITSPGVRVVELYSYCVCLTRIRPDGEPECRAADFLTGALAAKRPTMSIRQYDIVLAGQSATDATVQREIRETVRVRNDRLYGCCPATTPTGLVQSCES